MWFRPAFPIQLVSSKNIDVGQIMDKKQINLATVPTFQHHVVGHIPAIFWPILEKKDILVLSGQGCTSIAPTNLDWAYFRNSLFWG